MFENPNGVFSGLYVISQFFALTAFVFDILAIQQRKKANLLKLDTVAATCSFFHYLFLGAWPGIINKAITAFRNGLAAYGTIRKRKFPKQLPLVFVACYVIMGIFAFNSAASLLPVIAASIYSIAIYRNDIKTIRYVSIFTNALWLIYNITVLSIAGIVVQVLLTINSIVAVIRYGKRRKKAKTAIIKT